MSLPADDGRDAALIEGVRGLREIARARDQRRMVVVSGAAEWCRDSARRLIAALPGASVAWPQGSDGARALLGSECDLLVYDAHSGLDPDALGAASGSLRGGGLLVLLTPPLAAWPEAPDAEHMGLAVAGWPAEAIGRRYLRRFARLCANAQGALHIAEAAPAPPMPKAGDGTTPLAEGTAVPPRDAAEADQDRAVAALMRVARGQRRHPLVLTADRGRGKSAAFGMAAARLLQAGLGCILVTAPRREAVAEVFARARATLAESERGRDLLRLGPAELRYIAPDVLERERPAADLVLVDEAAGLGTPMLTALLRHYPRIAFATTIHGYEGSGQGFALRFAEALARHSRGARSLTLRHPMRWASDDPLESWINRALLLDAEPGPPTAEGPTGAGPRRLDREALADDEPLLREVFGLLTLAHYRTRPRDLRRWLDAPNVSIWALPGDDGLLATAVTAREGGLGEETAREVWAGRRRPQGHLMPEALAAQLGLMDAVVQRGERILRVAVHPAHRRQGYGRRLLEAIAADARGRELDYLGASFGATAELLAFWAGAGYRPVRLGLRRGAASGEHSVLMIQALSARGRRLAEAGTARFADDLPVLAADALRDVDAQLLAALLAGLPLGGEPPPEERRQLLAFAFGGRGAEACAGPLRRLALRGLAAGAPALDAAAAQLLVLRLVQGQSWAVCAQRLGLGGRAGVQAALRAATARALIAESGEAVLDEARALGLTPSRTD